MGVVLISVLVARIPVLQNLLNSRKFRFLGSGLVIPMRRRNGVTVTPKLSSLFRKFLFKVQPFSDSSIGKRSPRVNNSRFSSSSPFNVVVRPKFSRSRFSRSPLLLKFGPRKLSGHR